MQCAAIDSLVLLADCKQLITKVRMNTNINEIRKTELLQQCDQFAETLLKITMDFRIYGYTNRTLPYFPKAALLNIMGETKKSKQVLRGEELDQYLRSKLITLDMIILPTPEEQPHTSLDDLINKLYDGYLVLKNTYAKVLGCSLIYGQWLQVAFKYVNDPINVTGYRSNWEKWLSVNNIGIKVSHARMLRTLAKKFYKYKRFHNLSIPLTEFWSKRKEIDEMLQDNNIANYWTDK